jgi:hypothetical protein
LSLTVGALGVSAVPATDGEFVAGAYLAVAALALEGSQVSVYGA